MNSQNQATLSINNILIANEKNIRKLPNNNYDLLNNWKAFW